MKTLAARDAESARLPARAALERAARVGAALRVRAVPADDAGVRHHRDAARQRLLPLAAVHELERDQLCRRRFDRGWGRRAACRACCSSLSLSLGVAIGGYSLEIFGAFADRPATALAELLLGVRRRRLDLRELGVVGVAVAAQRRRGDGGAHARGARGGRSEHGGAAGRLSDAHVKHDGRSAMPKMKAYATFDLYLADQPPRNKTIIRALRAFVKRAAPKLREAVKWGNGCWVLRHASPWPMSTRTRATCNSAFFRGSVARRSRKVC